jgi:nicotinamide-nucleotide adenylyltransferase
LEIPQIIPEPRLTFLLGFDTLERLFSPRCYLDRTEEPMLDALRHFFDEGSTFVCAKRDPSSYPSFDTPPPTQSPAADLSRVGLEATAAGDQEWSAPIPSAAQEFISTKQITLIDIGAEEQTISSSNVRSLRLRAEDGGRWKNLVGLGVGRYIQEKELYLPSISDSCEDRSELK